MKFQFQIPTTNDPITISTEVGSSVIFVGANGAGKTRLAVHIEQSLQLTAHRIAAHRALNLNPNVPKIRELNALNKLRTGVERDDIRHDYRDGSRWGSKNATFLLNDYDAVVQALFAEQSNKTFENHSKARAGTLGQPEPTKLEILADIWDRLLPHRKLHLTGDNILVSKVGHTDTYPAADMSDGERAIFYLIGQALVAVENSVLIVDEPELHVHPSIMSKLWDELEALRKDCSFIYITHDLEFAANRNAQKYVIRDYSVPNAWVIEEVPEETGFSEEITTLILGSRKPILFIEGTGTSHDIAIYRNCYPEWTVLPRNSCEEVIHAVVTMRNNANLTRIKCAGIIDADSRSPEEITHLKTMGIETLAVSEVENLFLLPEISREIALTESYKEAQIVNLLDEVKAEVIAHFSDNLVIEKAALRYCRRQIDRTLKKVDLEAANDVNALAQLYANKTGEIDIANLAAEYEAKLKNAIQNEDLPKVLSLYDNKALIEIVARKLKDKRLGNFKQWIARVLQNDSHPNLKNAFKSKLPTISP